MIDSKDSGRFDRRQFGKLLGLAGVGGAAAMTGASAEAQQAQDWKGWVAKYFGKPVKMAVSCAGTTNPYFAPLKGGAEGARAQPGIEMPLGGVADRNTINQI